MGAEIAAVAKALHTNHLAAAIPYNANKPLEHGLAQSLQPPTGQTMVPESRLPTGSTLSEANGTQKTGSLAVEGVNASIAPLDRVRVDSGGQMLTNQGLAVADNQSSLKTGLRGPVLLEDFILREKITHFDHERIPERIVHARGSGAHDTFWDFVSLMPESTHMLMWVMSDRAIPRSYATTQGFVTVPERLRATPMHYKATFGLKGNNPNA